MAFKMKGSSLYGKINLNRGGNANRPDGRAKSSAFQKDTDPVEKKEERHSAKYDRVKKETDAMTPGDQEGRLANLAKEYGGTWTTEDRSGKSGSKGTYVNEKGETVKQAAVNQGQAANKKKKPGAPKKKDWAHKDYESGTSKIIAAAKGGASKQEIRAMVQAHNQSTIGKKYKKGNMSNSQINVRNMWSYMPKETTTVEKPVETTTVEKPVVKSELREFVPGTTSSSDVGPPMKKK